MYELPNKKMSWTLWEYDYKQEYLQNVEYLKKFFSGNTKSVKKIFEKKMKGSCK